MPSFAPLTSTFVSLPHGAVIGSCLLAYAVFLLWNRWVRKRLLAWPGVEDLVGERGRRWVEFFVFVSLVMIAYRLSWAFAEKVLSMRNVVFLLVSRGFYYLFSWYQAMYLAMRGARYGQ